MYIKNLGLPYMGNKKTIAFELCEFITQNNPNCKYFYDLFGGGGAMSFAMMQFPQIKKVIYNEIDKSITELLLKLKNDGLNDSFYKWVTRDEFNANKDRLDWYGGLLKTCWSFGNNKKNYLFGREIEEDKRLLHQIVVKECQESLKIFNQKHNLSLEMLKNDYLFDYKPTIKERRLYLTKQIKNRVDFDKKLQNLINIQQLEQLQRLQQLERLEQLQQLQQLQRLEILNKSYLDVKITTPINQTIIYCDPPYQNTALYNHSIDYDKFYNWVNNSPYKIYVSSYDAPLKKVFSIKKQSLLASGEHQKTVTENLYCNK